MAGTYGQAGTGQLCIDALFANYSIEVIRLFVVEKH